DLIVMDMTMPVMEGCEATRRLRDIPALAGVPVIAMSASATTEAEARALAAGANAFVAKPIEREALLDTIGALMNLAWTSEESVV
ncbi:MAG: response regulator, partial [Betaproteobacteria bacterium]